MIKDNVRFSIHHLEQPEPQLQPFKTIPYVKYLCLFAQQDFRCGSTVHDVLGFIEAVGASLGEGFQFESLEVDAPIRARTYKGSELSGNQYNARTC